MKRRTVVRARPWHTALAAGATALAATALTGCGASGTHSDAVPPRPHTAHATGTPAGTPAPKPHIVVYRVTGHGTASSIVYLSDGKSAKVRMTGVRLPWTRTLSLPGGAGKRAVSLVVDFTEIGGVTHDDSITVDGDILTQGSISGTGTGHSDLSGDIGD